MSTRKHDVPNELLDELLSDYQKPEDLIGENGLLKQLTKRLVERDRAFRVRRFFKNAFFRQSIDY